MWDQGLLYEIPAEIIVLVLCLAMIAAAAVGFRVALRHKRGKPPESHPRDGRKGAASGPAP